MQININENKLGILEEKIIGYWGLFDMEEFSLFRKVVQRMKEKEDKYLSKVDKAKIFRKRAAFDVIACVNSPIVAEVALSILDLTHDECANNHDHALRKQAYEKFGSSICYAGLPNFPKLKPLIERRGRNLRTLERIEPFVKLLDELSAEIETLPAIDTRRSIIIAESHKKLKPILKELLRSGEINEGFKKQFTSFAMRLIDRIRGLFHDEKTKAEALKKRNEHDNIKAIEAHLFSLVPNDQEGYMRRVVDELVRGIQQMREQKEIEVTMVSKPIKQFQDKGTQVHGLIREDFNTNSRSIPRARSLPSLLQSELINISNNEKEVPVVSRVPSLLSMVSPVGQSTELSTQNTTVRSTLGAIRAVFRFRKNI